MIHRFSSHRQPLDASFIQDRLADAVAYDRIAGFFRSSLLEVAGEPEKLGDSSKDRFSRFFDLLSSGNTAGVI